MGQVFQVLGLMCPLWRPRRLDPMAALTTTDGKRRTIRCRAQSDAGPRQPAVNNPPRGLRRGRNDRKTSRMQILKQVGALPVRRSHSGDIEVLLVTSRDTGRWIIPKGWPSSRLSDAKAAAREAKQEGGVVGKISAKPIGAYRYRKLEVDSARTVDVDVFLLNVKKEKKRWPEQEERQRAWLDIASASRKVREPRLRLLILSLQDLAQSSAAGKAVKRKT